LAQTLAYLTPSLLFWFGLNKDAVNESNIPHLTVIAFLIGSVLSLTTVWWSVHSTPELPLTPQEKETILAKPSGIKATLAEIVEAVRDMPQAMRQLWWMKLFQWYGMMCYWIYIVPSLARAVFDTSDASSEGFRDAGMLNGQIGGFYNFVAFIAAFALIPLTKRFGPKLVHAVCLTLAGVGMWCLPTLQDKALLFIPMVGVGLAWASIMGNPYIMLARSIPPERAGVYMGIFNMFIVLPMIIQMLTLPLFYDTLLGSDPRHVIQLAGCFLCIAAALTLRIKTND
jgi:maltose/moltooligosaccharide transporter